MRVLTVLAFTLALLAVSTAGAQDDNYVLTLETASSTVGGGSDFEVETILSFSGGDDIQGYQWGACHDEELLFLDPDAEDPAAVVNGAGIEDVDFTFQAVSVFEDDDPDGFSGYTVGALLNVITGEVIEPVDDLQMFVGTYTAAMVDDETDTTIEFCEDLGSPVVTVRVVVEGDEIEPTSADGSLTVTITGAPVETYFYVATDASTTFTPTTGASSNVTTTISIEESDENADFPQDSQGFQMGIMHDGDVVEIVSVDSGDLDGVWLGELADLNDGDGPDFFGANYDPEGGPGFTVGVVYNLFGGVFIAFDGALDMFTLEYDPVDDNLIDVLEDVTTTIDFVDTLGDPVLPNSVVVGGDSIGAIGTSGTITLSPAIATPFISGDADEDGVVNIEDPIYIIEALFQDGAPISCTLSADVTGTTIEVDLDDIVYLLEYLFLEATDPPAPFPGCGTIVDQEDDDCVSHAFCE